jgi:hypothetical protein
MKVSDKVQGLKLTCKFSSVADVMLWLSVIYVIVV